MLEAFMEAKIAIRMQCSSNIDLNSMNEHHVPSASFLLTTQAAMLQPQGSAPAFLPLIAQSAAMCLKLVLVTLVTAI